MPCNQEGDQVVHDALVRHLFPGFGIDATEHGVEKIPTVGALSGFAGLEHLACRLPEDLNIRIELLVLCSVKDGRQRRPPPTGAALDKKVGHGVDKGMHLG